MTNYIVFVEYAYFSLTSLAAALAAGAARLQAELLAALLERVQTLLRPPGQVNVHRGPHAGAQVGWARVQVPVPGFPEKIGVSFDQLGPVSIHSFNSLGVQQEVLARLCLDRVADTLDAARQALKDALEDSGKKV